MKILLTILAIPVIVALGVATVGVHLMGYNDRRDYLNAYHHQAITKRYKHIAKRSKNSKIKLDICLIICDTIHILNRADSLEPQG